MTDFSKLIAQLVASATIEEEKDEVEGMEESDMSEDEEP